MFARHREVLVRAIGGNFSLSSIVGTLLKSDNKRREFPHSVRKSSGSRRTKRGVANKLIRPDWIGGAGGKERRFIEPENTG